eukprot:3808669-Prymnesium_polylepis.2
MGRGVGRLQLLAAHALAAQIGASQRRALEASALEPEPVGEHRVAGRGPSSAAAHCSLGCERAPLGCGSALLGRGDEHLVHLLELLPLLLL